MELYSHVVDLGKIKGEIKVELFSWQERMEKSKEIVYKVEGDTLVNRHEFEQGKATIETTISRIREVSIKCGKIEIDSVEKLLKYKEGIDIVNEISPILLNGVSLAKN